MRPDLTSKLLADEFLNYYWLKEELVDFCKKFNIPRSGSKHDLNTRIEYFLRTGNIESNANPKSIRNKASNTIITRDCIIPIHYKNDEKHRSFFKAEIGQHFKFNVQFMDWMKNNSGKTYNEAIDKWIAINKDKKNGKKTIISPQFEYNQYTRDFFDSNPGKSKSDAIKCWNYKKNLNQDPINMRVQT